MLFIPIAILVPALSGACSKDSREDASDTPFMISASVCCMLHGMLVMIHIILAISYIFHWEHRVTLPFTPANNDFWSVVLSVSLQAFYTVRVHCYVFSARHQIALLDLHCCSTLPHPTTFDFNNTCPPCQTNCHS
jgi:hypothetical protein